MSDVYSICQEILDKFDRAPRVIWDIAISINAPKREKYVLPAVFVNESAVAVFVRFDECSSRCTDVLANAFRNVLRALVERTDLSLNSFMLYGVGTPDGLSDEELATCSFNIYNDRITYFSHESEQLDYFIDSVVTDFSYRRPVFDEKTVADVSFNLELLSSNGGQIKKDSEGNYLVQKHGQWYLASELDPDDTFHKTALFGAFGAHKFLEKKMALGLLYFITCGLVGVGWFFDSLSILLGIYRDSEGRYLLPVTNRKACFSKMAVGLGITLVYGAFFWFVLNIAGTALESAVGQAINS